MQSLRIPFAHAVQEHAMHASQPPLSYSRARAKGPRARVSRARVYPPPPHSSGAEKKTPRSESRKLHPIYFIGALLVDVLETSAISGVFLSIHAVLPYFADSPVCQDFVPSCVVAAAGGLVSDYLYASFAVASGVEEGTYIEECILPALYGTVSTASATVDGRGVWGGGGCCTLCTVSASSVFADGRGVCAWGVHSDGPGWASELGSVDVLYAALCSIADLAFPSARASAMSPIKSTTRHTCTSFLVRSEYASSLA